jgi:ribosome-binding factor A
MSHRIAQVESTLKRAICQVLQRQISDPRIDGLVSVTKIKVTPDMRTAFVHVSILPKEKQSKAIHGLQHASRHIQKLASRHITMRTMPHLEFRIDENLKKQAAVMDAIRQGLERTDSDGASDAESEDVTSVQPEDENHTAEGHG